MENTEILKIAIKNAIDHEGKASEGAVISKVIGQDKSVLKEIEKLKAEVSRIVGEVNTKTYPQLLDMADEAGMDLSEKKPVEPSLELKPLPNVKGRVVLRLPPEPSGYMHFGHAISFMINYLYREKYNGKLWLRFEDTNPKLLNKMDEYVDSFEEGLKWLGVKWDEKKFISSDMELIYSYGEKLIQDSMAYVCLCTVEEIKAKRLTGNACKHREQSIGKNIELWGELKSGKMNDGEAIVRFKYDMDSKDFALRDPSIFRIIKNDYKPYSLWPIYDFASVIEDHVCGVTHILRSSEFKVNVQDKLREAMDLNHPNILQYGRYNFKGTPFSKRKIRALIKEGYIRGWEDIRLPTLTAIRRRGIQPEAIKEFVLSVGYSGSQHEYSWDLLFTLNRRIIDERAKRFFFVSDPVSLNVVGAKEAEARLQSHPSKELGLRIIKTSGKFFIERKDLENVKVGDVIRLKDLYDIKLKEKTGAGAVAEFCSSEFDGKEKIIHWVTDDNVKTKVTIVGALLNDDESFNKDSLKVVDGLGERSLQQVKKGDIVQFERFGFCILDDDKTRDFIFISR